MLKGPCSNAYGTWKVTTERDCEGRSMRDLGTYTGYIDEIAFALADKCCYSLCFKAIVPKSLDITPKHKSVVITLDIDSGTWDMRRDERVKAIGNLLRDRDVHVEDSPGYASVKLITGKKTVEEKRADALAKLTEEERKLLGLE